MVEAVDTQVVTAEVDIATAVAATVVDMAVDTVMVDMAGTALAWEWEGMDTEGMGLVDPGTTRRPMTTPQGMGIRSDTVIRGMGSLVAASANHHSTKTAHPPMPGGFVISCS